MKKIVVSSLVGLFVLSCSVPVSNNSTHKTSPSLSGRMPHSDFRWSQYAPTGLRDTSYPSLQTPLLGGAGVGSLHPSLNFAELEKEYKSFSTKALSDAYVKRMFGKYLNPVNQTQLTRQLEFSRYLKNDGDTSYETSLKAMFAQTPALYDTMTGASAPDIQNKMSTESATFGDYVEGLSPYIPAALPASDITRNSFTANWNKQDYATDYILYVSDGTNISTINITGGNTISYSVTGLTPNKTYTYYLKSINQNIESPPSNIISVTTFSQIVYSSNKSGNSEIYLMNSDGSNEQRLTNTSYVELDPMLSQDGTKITYFRQPNSTTYQYSIYTMNSDGTGVSLYLAFVASPLHDYASPYYSPDNNWILYQYNSNSSTPTNLWDIYKKNISKTSTVVMANQAEGQGHPAFSRDGNKIVYVTLEYSLSAREIKIADSSNGANKVRITNSTQNELLPSFSPDGSKIIYTRNKTGGYEVCSINVNGTDTTILTPAFTSTYGGTYSPNGSKIVFWGDNGTSQGIFVADSNGSNPVLIKSLGTASISGRINWN